MVTKARLRAKLSPLENVKFTKKVTPLLAAADFTPYLRQYKGETMVVMTPREAYALLLDTPNPDLHDLTVMGRSLQALLWERSYLKGQLVFTKTLREINEDGY